MVPGPESIRPGQADDSWSLIRPRRGWAGTGRACFLHWRQLLSSLRPARLGHSGSKCTGCLSPGSAQEPRRFVRRRDIGAVGWECDGDEIQQVETRILFMNGVQSLLTGDW